MLPRFGVLWEVSDTKLLLLPHPHPGNPLKHSSSGRPDMRFSRLTSNPIKKKTFVSGLSMVELLRPGIPQPIMGGVRPSA